MSQNKHSQNKTNNRLAADGLEDFVNYVSSPWRIIWVNFVIGIFRGLGAIVGATIVIAIIIWLLGLFTNIPLLGKYTKEIDQVVSDYFYKTDYNDELDSVGNTLLRIEKLLNEQAIEQAKQKEINVKNTAN